LYLAVRRAERALQAGDEPEAIAILRAALERLDDPPPAVHSGEKPEFESAGFR
jgi:hypothetical protein